VYVLKKSQKYQHAPREIFGGVVIQTSTAVHHALTSERVNVNRMA
jgi:hypothetical protein